MKKLLCVLTALALIPSAAFAENIIPAAENTYSSFVGEAAVLSEAAGAKTQNTDGVFSLVVCFYDFAQNTISRLDDVLNFEVLMDNIYRIDFKSSAAAEKAYTVLKSHPNVKTADYDKEIKFDLEDPYIESEEPAAMPSDNDGDDVFYNDYNLYGNANWYLNDIKAPDAWKIMREYNVSGNSAIVAVVDSGVDTANPDLKNRILKDANGDLVGYNMVNTATLSFEDDYADSYHGTRVASAIAAEANNGVGICGAAGEFDVKILPIKVFDSNGAGATASVLIKAIDKAIEHNADVINMSLSSSVPLNAVIDNKVETLQEAINRAVEAGCVVVGAAGNEYSNQPLYPASYDNVISVSAYDSTRKRADFSQYNDYIDVAAPGRGMALLKHSVGGSITSSTVNQSSAGTSFSAPLVSAAAALLRIANPDITATEISNIIKNTTDDLGKKGYDIHYGFGALNLAATVENAFNGFVEIKSLNYTKSLSVAVGEAEQIETVIMPQNAQNKIIKYESADTSIATVSNNGVVFGVSPGEVDIYITTDFDTEFSKDENGKNYMCHVFVKPGITADGKINVDIGDSTFPRDTGGDEFAVYADAAIYQFKKSGNDVTVEKTKEGLGKKYEFCEYIPGSVYYKYALTRDVDHKIVFATDATLKEAASYADSDTGNPTYTAVVGNGKTFTVLSSTGRILRFTLPDTKTSFTPEIFTMPLNASSNTVFMNDIVYVADTSDFYVLTGQDKTGEQYMYITDFSKDSGGSVVFKRVGVSLSSGETYEKILVEGRKLYVLTNKAVYTITTGRTSSNEIATTGVLKKYADIDSKLIKDIAMITVGSSRTLVGFGAKSSLYLIEQGGGSVAIKQYGGTLTNLAEFNNTVITIADGTALSEKVTYTAPENKSVSSQLCTYRINILDKNKRLTDTFPSDGKFTVEYYIESIDRIVFENSLYTNSGAQNKLPVSVVFAVYDKATDTLADIRVNNFMLDYVYLSSSPDLSFGSLLRCEETFDLSGGDYYAKVMTFKGNNFYWPEKGKESTTLDVFTKPLE